MSIPFGRETGIRTNKKGLTIKTEIGLSEIGLEQRLARKICNYVDHIDKITSSIVNIEHKSSITEKTLKRKKTRNKTQSGNVEHESSTKVT